MSKKPSSYIYTVAGLIRHLQGYHDLEQVLVDGKRIRGIRDNQNGLIDILSQDDSESDIEETKGVKS